MTKVLVASRTRMSQGRVCVGGHDLERDFRSLRLLTKGGLNLKEEDGIDVGEVWELEYEPRPEVDAPHLEDVLVQTGEPVETLLPERVRALILENETPWNGGPAALFDGTVAATPSGRVHVPGEGSLPGRSTGYWLPDADIVRYTAFDKPKFQYAGGGELSAFSWAGMANPPRRIAAGTLVRVSLARWFDPETAPAGYYAQISGVF